MYADINHKHVFIYLLGKDKLSLCNEMGTTVNSYYSIIFLKLIFF